jgi:microcystin-dependent protein
MGGSSTVTLTRQELPAHNHAFMTAGADVTTPIFSDAVTFGNMKPPSVQYLKNAAFGSVGKQYPSDRTISDSGGSKSHDNTMPSMTLNYIIALEGHYPQF